MPQPKPLTPESLIHQLHDSVISHTYLGLNALKKFINSMDEDALSEAQKNDLFLCFLNIRKAYDNVDKITHQDMSYPLDESQLFPTLKEVVHAYGQGQIILENNLCNMSSTLSQKLGICLFELVINQLKHNRFDSCSVYVHSKGSTTYASFVFKGASPIPPAISKQQKAAYRFGLSLVKQRLKQWGGRITMTQDKAQQTIEWQIQLPTDV